MQDACELEQDLTLDIAFALKKSGKVTRRDRLDEPHVPLAREVIEHLRRCGWTFAQKHKLPRVAPSR